jgi:hypothetical protein
MSKNFNFDTKTISLITLPLLLDHINFFYLTLTHVPLLLFDLIGRAQKVRGLGLSLKHKMGPLGTSKRPSINTRPLEGLKSKCHTHPECQIITEFICFILSL